jgi:hypothetical protein
MVISVPTSPLGMMIGAARIFAAVQLDECCNGLPVYHVTAEFVSIAEFVTWRLSFCPVTGAQADGRDGMLKFTPSAAWGHYFSASEFDTPDEARQCALRDMLER